MPTARVNGCDYAYEDRGSGSPVLFAHGLTFDRHMWDPQVEALSGRYRCIAIDFRGHGRSASPPGEYTLEQMAEDVHQLLQGLGVSAAHIVGLSMGGMVAMRLALAHPQVVRSLGLLGTSAEVEVAEHIPQYEGMIQMSLAQGPQAVVDGVVPIMFSQGFIGSQPAKVEAYRQLFLANNVQGVASALYAVTRRRDILDDIAAIKVPTLIIVGEADIATTPEKAQHIQERIASSRLVTIPGAAHMTPIEQPERITELLSQFLAEAEAGAGK